MRCAPRTPAQEDEMTNRATGDIAPKALQTPRAAGLAGVLFAVLFGVVVFLFHKVVPANPDAAGGWLANAGHRRDIQFSLGLVPFCGIFFLWFMGAVRARVGESEDKFFATVFLGSGLLFVAMLFVLAATFGALVSLAAVFQEKSFSMPFRMSCCQAALSLKTSRACRMVANICSPVYSVNLKPVPRLLTGSKFSIVSSSPPVARTMGAVP